MRNGYGHMVHDYYVAKLRAMRAQRKAELDGLTTRLSALAYRDKVRAAIREAFGPLPEKTPLNARVTGVIKGDRYRIEKVIYESRPGCLVTASLYVPNGLDAPAPCVLGTCGHSADGKACDLYQGFSQRLAVAGFVVLLYDPYNQGERDQYALVEGGEAMASCTTAHNMMGKQMELVGDYFGTWRAWDGIRGLDYLLARPEVDPTRVGLTGNSGGGTMTTWLWPLDDRFTMAAPGCFVTTFLSNLENELPADCEQYPPGVLGAGLEMADFLIARAPNPVLVLGQHYDFFDRRGHQEACDEVRRFYELMGEPLDLVGCYRGPHGHGYLTENQIEMVDFFARHAGIEGYTTLDETIPLPPSDLFCTPTGNVMQAGSKAIFAFTAERAEALAAERPPVGAASLREALTRLLSIPDDQPTPHYRCLRPIRAADHTTARYAIETEPGIQAILSKRLIDVEHPYTLDVEGTVHLYLPHTSAEAAFDEDTKLQELAAAGDVYALDVRGLGESMPYEEGPFFAPYGMDYMFHGHGLLFGESYLGRRVYDVLRTMDLLIHEGATEIRLYGRGQGGLLALFAAVLAPEVAHIALINTPRSFIEWTRVPLENWPSTAHVRDILAELDLDDCVGVLGKKVEMIEPWGPGMGLA